MEVEKYSPTFLDGALRTLKQQNRAKDGYPHLSEITGDLDNRLHHPERLNRDRLTHEAIRQLDLYAEIGWIWEQMVEAVWKSREVVRRKGELGGTEGEGVSWSQEPLFFGGIHMTPDIYYLEGDRVIVEDEKATWRSMRDIKTVWTSKFFEWDLRLRGYAKALGTRYVRFHVLWVNGDYKQRTPDSTKINLVYSQADIDSAWKQIKTHQAVMESEGKKW